MTYPPAAAPAAPAALPSPRPAISISVEALLWAALIAAAAALRLGGLTRPPFALAEASRAFDAFQVSEGTVPDGWSGDLVAAATSYLFRLFGDGDLPARLLPAIAGAALVALLWFARPWVGRAGALVAALLVAFSPLFVLFARSGLAFSFGAMLAAVMAFSLFAYLREPRPWPLFALALALGLAPLTDAVAVSAAIALLAFLALERAFFPRGDVARAWAVFRSSPIQWLSVLLVAAAALQLGLTHFGTSIDRSGLPGLRLWVDMFDLPRDGRAPDYQPALLLAYDWPLLLAGGLGFSFLALRLRRGGADALSPLQRFLLLWTALAALTIALVTRREAGQLLILLLPLALLAGSLADEIADHLDWSVLARWWPAVAACLGLVAYAALQLSEWSRPDTGARAVAVALSLAAACAAIAVTYPFLSRNSATLLLTVVAAVTVAFSAHSSLALAFGGGSEFATDLRIDDRAYRFRDTLKELAAERGGTVVVDAELAPALAWPLRDSPVVFAADSDSASTFVAPADGAPTGFLPLGEAWRVAQGWYPRRLLSPLSLWRWLVFREPYDNLDTLDVRIYIPTP